MPPDSSHTVLALLTLTMPEFIQESYGILLGRRAEAEEVAARAGALCSGWGRVRLLEDIVRSPEFAARERRLLEDSSDQAFVELTYLRYMNRMPDPHGLAYYIGRLGAGKTRAKVRNDIANSSEARAAYSFWVELERLLSDERKNMRRPARWFGRDRRRERRHNLEMELLRRQGEVETEQWRGYIERLSLSMAATGSVEALPIDSSTLPPDARRMLSRLRHFKKKTWSVPEPKQGIA